MNLSKRLLLCVCFCFGFIAADAQYRIDQWTADNGLPQNSIYEIVQTGDGYLWLATVDGLARFDGARFTVFNKSNSPGIVNNRFISLFETAGGDLWAGTEESGVARFHDGRFEHFGAGSGIPRSVIWIEADAGDGAIFHIDNRPAANGDGAVSNVDSPISFSDGNFLPLEPRVTFSPAGRAARSSSIRIICRSDSENRFSECFINGQWIRFSFADGAPKAKFVSVAQETYPDGSPQVRFISAAQDASGIVWLITADGRLARAEAGLVTRVFDERDGLPKYPLYLMSGSRLGLVGKDAAGSLWLIDLPSMRRELLLKDATVSPPLLDKAEILSTYQDGEGNLWFGTTRDGLFRARKQIVSTYSETDGITNKNVYPIYEDRAGTIWIGTTGGLFKYENGTFALVESTEHFLVHAIGEDAIGRIFISSLGELYVQENKRFVPFERGRIPAADFIYAIRVDRENALWIGGDSGLSCFKDGVVTRFSTADGLAGNDVKVIIEAKAGGLWIGTYGGLTHYNDGKFTSWREVNGLPSSTVRSLYEDRDSTLWIGSYDGGLARFKDGIFTRYNTKTGLPNDGAFQILEDDNRNLWISSNRGIYSVSKDELNEFAEGRRSNVTTVAYGKSDGMRNAECNGGRSPAGIRARDGRLWFPTQDGVAVINPSEIKVNLIAPPVVIESVKIDNIRLEPPSAAGVLIERFDSSPATLKDYHQSSADADGSDVIIKPHQQNFEISYTALSFINSDNLQFKYKLEGLDDDWIDAGTRRQAYFSHVPPGAYMFRVIAANSDGVWNEQGATLKIVVLSPFYRTWWFLILASFAIVATAYLLFRRRVSQINLKHTAELVFSRRLIDSQEQERKRFAAEMHDGLGQSLVIIKNRARLSLKQADQKALMLDHLEHISETASHAIHEAREIAFNLRPHLLDRLGLTKTIQSMLGKVFGASGIEFEAEIDLIDDVLENDSEILLYRIVQECANNIVKHSQAEKAFLRIERGEHDLSVKISDNGRGFDPSVSDDDLSKRSFGLVGIAERTRLLGGKLNIESKPGQGATVSIIIDL